MVDFALGRSGYTETHEWWYVDQSLLALNQLSLTKIFLACMSSMHSSYFPCLSALLFGIQGGIFLISDSVFPKLLVESIEKGRREYGFNPKFEFWQILLVPGVCQLTSLVNIHPPLLKQKLQLLCRFAPMQICRSKRVWFCETICSTVIIGFGRIIL